MQGGQAPQSRLGAPPNLLATLYDMEFKRFLGEGAVKFLYWLTVILASLFAAVSVIGAFFSANPLLIVVTIVLVVLFYLLQLIYARVILEALTLVFRMSGDVRTILGAIGGAPASGGAAPAGAGGGGATPPGYPQYPPYSHETPYQQYPQEPQAQAYPSDPPYPPYPEGPGYTAGTQEQPPDPSDPIDDDEPWIT